MRCYAATNILIVKYFLVSAFNDSYLAGKGLGGRMALLPRAIPPLPPPPELLDFFTAFDVSSD